MINREELIAAYLDGELDSEEHKQVTQMLAEDPASQELLASFQKLRADLRSLPNYEIDGDLTDQVLGRLAEMSAGSATAPSRPPAAERMVERGKRVRIFLWPAVALAAALLVMVFSYEGPFEEPVTRLDREMQAQRTEEKARSDRDSTPSPANEAVLSGSFFSADTAGDSLDEIPRSTQSSAARPPAPREAGQLGESRKQRHNKGKSADHFRNSEDPTAATLADRGSPAGRAPPLPTYTFRVDRGVDPHRELDRLLGKALHSGPASADRLMQIDPRRRGQKNSELPAGMVYELTGTDQQIRQLLRELQAARGIRLVVVSADNDHKGFAKSSVFGALGDLRADKGSNNRARRDKKKEMAFESRPRTAAPNRIPAEPGPIAAQVETTLGSEEAAAEMIEKSTLPEAALQQVRLVFVIGRDAADSLPREPQQQPAAGRSGGPSGN